MEIGVDEEEVVWWCGPKQLRALRGIVHSTQTQFEQRS
jgi:hypothetical protein